MHAAILAAGEGTRLSLSFPGTPKPLVRIKGEPLVDWLLLHLDSAGFHDISIVIRQDASVAAHLDTLRLSANLHVVARNTSGGMYSLLALRHQLESEPDFYLFSIDNIFDPGELSTFMQKSHSFTDRTLTSWVTKRKNSNKGQVGIQIDRDMRIWDLGKQLTNTALVAEGPYHCFPSIFDGLAEAQKLPISRLTEYLHHLLTLGHRLYGYYVPEVFDVDDVDDLREAAEFLGQIEEIT
jgi:NDP-sugar pyrophosphorylase family protein